MTGVDFFTQIALKSSLLLLAAFGGVVAMRHRPAALRHFVWTTALCALLVLPLLAAVTPQWGWREVKQETVVAVRRGRVRVRSAPAAPVRRPEAYWLVAIWAAGFTLASVRFAIGAVRTARMVRRATPAEHASGAAGVPVLESPEVPMALAWGIRRPAVVLPVDAREWPDARLRTVVLHELTHVERRDLLAQAAGQLACCLYWFHPLVWLAARQLRKERERACDDAVLLRGIAAHDYAAHLVELVRAMAARKSQWAGAAGMAERSDLESRVRALLDRKRARHPLSRRAAVAVTSLAIAVLLPLAALSSYAQAVRGSLSGVVRDPSGAVIPNAEVTAKNLDGSNQEVTWGDAAGEYRFMSIPPGRYELEVGRVAGFNTLKAPVVVTAGVATRMDAMMSIGSPSQTVQVSASGRKAQVAPSTVSPGPGQRIRVGGNVQQTRVVTQVHPVYPEDAKAQGVEGTVLIQAIISKSGEVGSARVANTDVDPRLAKAALEAVEQWHYLPTLLNGLPVENTITITISFNLDQ